VGVVLVDQDGVLADFERGLLASFRARYPAGPAIELADRTVFRAREQYGPGWGPKISAIIGSAGFYRGLPVIPGGAAALTQMRQAGHDVFVCTTPDATSPYCAGEKLDWVAEHLGPDWRRRTIITPDKTLIGDQLRPCVLVDDRPDLPGVASPPWTQILFDAPYNRAAPGPRLADWTRWREVIEPALAAQHRPEPARDPR
jgi:5'-nucleotidase